MSGVLIIGTGPGISTSVAKRFGREGLPVGLIARTGTSLTAAQAALAEAGLGNVHTAVADAAEENELRSGIEMIVSAQGVPNVLVYNAGLIQFDSPGQLDTAAHLHAYTVNVLGALTAATHLAAPMADSGGGTILFTGGMAEADPQVLSLSLGKAALRSLTGMLAEHYAGMGIHVASVTVCGPVAPQTDFDPDRIAEQYWRLHRQPRPEWEVEVLYRGERSLRVAELQD